MSNRNRQNREPRPPRPPRPPKPPKVQKIKKIRLPKTVEEVRTYSLALSLLAAVILPYFSVIILHQQGASFFFYCTAVISLCMFLAAEYMMFLIYDAKTAIEKEAWAKINATLTAGLTDPAELNAASAKVRTIWDTYIDSRWIRPTPPFALVIYILIVCIGFNVILLNISDLENWMDSSTRVTLILVIFGVWAMLSTKFINDVYNLVKNYRRVSKLNETY